MSNAHNMLRGVTAHWSSTAEVAGRAGASPRASGPLYELAARGLVEVTRPGTPPRWRLTERGAAMPRDLSAASAASK